MTPTPDPLPLRNPYPSCKYCIMLCDASIFWHPNLVLPQALREVVSSAWGDVHVAISGLTNTYSSYITTYEEYQVQRCVDDSMFAC